MAYPLKFQDEVFKTLERLYEGGRFPHALIFEGPEGSGRQTAARYAASLLLCRADKKTPCGECRSCRRELANHPDFEVVTPENKSRTISVDRIRAVRLSAFVSPHEGERKVYLIPEAERMRTEAQNALLKLIEEPPKSAFFIMTAVSRQGLLETVVSRSTVIPMAELDCEERLSVLRGRGIKGGALEALARGCATVGEAMEAAGDPEAASLIFDAGELLRKICAGERYGALTLLSRYEKERERYIRLFKTARSSAIAGLCAQDAGTGTLRTGKIADIIDSTVFSASQNAALPLLSCAAVNRLIAAAFSAG